VTLAVTLVAILIVLMTRTVDLVVSQ